MFKTTTASVIAYFFRWGNVVKGRTLVFAAAGLAMATPAAAAENWQEYSFEAAGFSAHFPGRPIVSDRRYPSTQAPGGRLTERVYSSNEGGVIYSIGIVDFSTLPADPDEAVGEVTDGLAALGELVFDTSCYVDQMHGREIIVRGNDGTSHTDAIFWIKKHLYQIKVVYPAVNTDPAGSSGIGLFLAKFHFIDPY
jgi:hypothetical protein